MQRCGVTGQVAGPIAMLLASFNRLLASLARSGHIRLVAGLFRQVHTVQCVQYYTAGEVRTCTANVFNIIENARIRGVLSDDSTWQLDVYLYTSAKHYIILL